MGIRSSGGAGQNRYPNGKWTARANFSVCFKVGRVSPVSHRANLGNLVISFFRAIPEGSPAQRITSGLAGTRNMPVTSLFKVSNWNLSSLIRAVKSRNYPPRAPPTTGERTFNPAWCLAKRLGVGGPGRFFAAIAIH